MKALFWVGALLLAGCAPKYNLVKGPPNVNPGDVTPCGFTRVDDTAFYRYDCNPVFTTSGEDWAPTIGTTAFAVTEVLGVPFYQLWYTGGPNDPNADAQYGIGYAVSPEGTEWTPAATNPGMAPSPGKAWDHSIIDAMQVKWDPQTSQYAMIYQGVNLDTSPSTWGLGVATSPDGKAWKRLQTNSGEVLDLTKPTGNVTQWCWPLGLSLGDIAGYTGYIAGDDTGTGSICQAYRLGGSDLNTWKPDTKTPFFAAGAKKDWDSKGQVGLATATLGDTDYLFYVGFGGWTQHSGYQTTKNSFLGWATSTDGGTTWTRGDPNPIPINTTTEGEVTAIAANTVDNRIHLWVTDQYPDAAGDTAASTKVTAVGYFLFDPDQAKKDDGP